MFTPLPFCNTCTNRRAGQLARLAQLYNSKGPWKNNQSLDGTPPAAFHQSFANSGELAFCSGKHNGEDCRNDGLQYDKTGLIHDPSTNCSNTVPHEHLQYRLRGGEIIVVPDEFEVGHRIWLPREHHATLLVEQSRAHIHDRAQGSEQFEHMVGNLYMQEDFVDERIS